MGAEAKGIDTFGPDDWEAWRRRLDSSSQEVDRALARTLTKKVQGSAGGVLSRSDHRENAQVVCDEAVLLLLRDQGRAELDLSVEPKYGRPINIGPTYVANFAAALEANGLASEPELKNYAQAKLKKYWSTYRRRLV